MKILGIVGSQRKKGNTATLVKRALEGAKNEGAQTELLFLGDHVIKDCSGCEACQDTHRCVVDDDMQKIYPILMEADAIILGSPTYFYNVTAQVKAFIDRCYCFNVFTADDRSCWISINEALGGKYAVTVAVCEQHDERDMGFTSEAMSKPLEALGYRVVDNVKAIGLFEKGAACQDDEKMAQARRAGVKLAKVIKLRKETEAKLKSCSGIHSSCCDLF